MGEKRDRGVLSTDCRKFVLRNQHLDIRVWLFLEEKKGGTSTYVTPTTPSLRLVGDLALGSSPLPEVDGSTIVLLAI